MLVANHHRQGSSHERTTIVSQARASFNTKTRVSFPVQKTGLPSPPASSSTHSRGLVTRCLTASRHTPRVQHSASHFNPDLSRHSNLWRCGKSHFPKPCLRPERCHPLSTSALVAPLPFHFDTSSTRHHPALHFEPQTNHQRIIQNNNSFRLNLPAESGKRRPHEHVLSFFVRRLPPQLGPSLA